MHFCPFFLQFLLQIQAKLLIKCPLFLVSNADRVSWWELTLLASHVHRSVSTMARTMLSGNNIVYSGDPLTYLSLAAFLAKFLEKKPKGNRIAHESGMGDPKLHQLERFTFISCVFPR
jgi:hypothetical protein